MKKKKSVYSEEYQSCFVFGYRFAEDRANFSISTDDPMVTGQQLQGDYELVNNYWGLTEADLLRAVSNICEHFFQLRLSHLHFAVTCSQPLQWLHGINPSEKDIFTCSLTGS